MEVLFDEARTPTDYRFVEVNRAFERQTGLVDAVGKRMRELAPSHEEHWFEAYGRVALTGEPTRFQNCAKALGRWYEVYAFRAGEPEHRRVAILFNDITQRKRTEEALRASEARAHTISTNVRDHLVVLEALRGADGLVSGWRCTDANEGALDLLAPGRDGVIGRTVREVLGERGRTLEERMARVLATGAPDMHETDYRGRHLLVSVFRIDANTLGIAAFDLTDRERATAELRHAAELLDLGDAFLELDRDWRIVRINRNQEKLSQRPRSEVLGRVLWEVWPEAARPDSKYWIEYHRCMDERVPVKFDEHFAPLALWTGVSAYPTSTGIVVFFRDATDRKLTEAAIQAANAQLREADRRKNDFLAMLSHELRNPLAPIRNSIYVLDRASPGGEQARRAHSVIDRQVRHLTRLVDDLLDVTRISRGKIRLQPERVELNGLLRRTADDHREDFVRSGIVLDLTLPSDPVHVSADATRLAQVFGNLLQNAAKFTPRGGHVALSLEEGWDRRTATIAVRDSGAGISAEMLPRLFEPFVQGESTLDRSRGGLGLGLALVNGLVKLHGGTVSAHSDGAGKGATFIVRLPVEAAEMRRAPTASPGGEPGLPRRVLVIEDHVDAAESLREALAMNDHEVEVALTGAEGLAKARAFRPDLVLCDLGLPEMDGYEVATRMRADPELRSIRLVALSGYALPEDLERSRAAGFDLHLAKPMDLDRLERSMGDVQGTAQSQ